jgi:hypothetical protein
MMLHLFTWSPDRKTFVEGMVTAGFATLDENGEPIWNPECQVDEIGPIAKTDINGDTTIVGGHHCNLRGWGSLVEGLTIGLPQTDKDGNPLSLFQRTRILTVVPCEWEEIPGPGVPAGYKGPHGVVLIDPAVVATPYRVWA